MCLHVWSHWHGPFQSVREFHVPAHQCSLQDTASFWLQALFTPQVCRHAVRCSLTSSYFSVSLINELGQDELEQIELEHVNCVGYAGYSTWVDLVSRQQTMNLVSRLQTMSLVSRLQTMNLVFRLHTMSLVSRLQTMSLVSRLQTMSLVSRLQTMNLPGCRQSQYRPKPCRSIVLSLLLLHMLIAGGV